MARFSDLAPAIGSMLQLNAVQLKQVKLFARLVGYVEDRAILVTAPLLYGGLTEITVGDVFVVRNFDGKHAHAFQTEVQQAAKTPFPHLFLAYPDRVDDVAARQAGRVIIRRNGSLTSVGPGGLANEPALIVDLSLNGAGVECRRDFAKLGESVLIRVPPETAFSQPELRLRATVRSIREAAECEDPNCAFFGLEFVDLGPEQNHALAEIVQLHRPDEL
jgi:hypothetical protein